MCGTPIWIYSTDRAACECFFSVLVRIYCSVLEVYSMPDARYICYFFSRCSNVSDQRTGILSKPKDASDGKSALYGLPKIDKTTIDCVVFHVRVTHTQH